MNTVVSYGGGVNSTALLVGIHEQGGRPDLVLFSDTGGEHEDTYRTVEMMDAWCRERWGLPITTVSNAGREGFPHTSLEDECITNKTLPSLAFGFKGCSAKWKRQPMDRFVRSWQPAIDAWERGEKVERLIGIDADEAHRSAALVEKSDPRFVYRRPLVEWDWGRDECLAAIERAGLEVPRKSACWFCPAMKKREVLELSRTHPELFARAVEMERNASENLATVRGLGRSWSWEELVRADEAQLKLFPDMMEEPCGCYDGTDEEE